MRALIDYRPALRDRTGVGEYVHELAKALSDVAPSRGWSLGIFTSSWKDRPLPGLARELGNVEAIDRRIPGKILNLAWHRLQRPAVERVAGPNWDVVHAAHPLLIPTREAAQLVTIHDLDFLRHPERTHAEIRRDYPALAAAHARRADRIITSSEFTAGEIERELRVSRDRISVCRAGAPQWPAAAATLPLNMPSDPYILFVGTLEPRKNVSGLLDGYERLLASDGTVVPSLVIAGRQTSAAEQWIRRASRSPLAGRVVFTGYVPEESRRALYERATMLVLPSHHEGFGMPVLEAMSLGVPVIASRRGSLPEVLGDAGLLVDPDDSGALSAAMQRLLVDEQLATVCRHKGQQRAREFTWRAAAERVIDAYELAVETRRARRTRR